MKEKSWSNFHLNDGEVYHSYIVINLLSYVKLQLLQRISKIELREIIG